MDKNLQKDTGVKNRHVCLCGRCVEQLVTNIHKTLLLFEKAKGNVVTAYCLALLECSFHKQRATTVEAMTCVFCRKVGTIWELWVPFVHISWEGASSSVSLVGCG